MTYQLRLGLSWCRAGNHVIFLDQDSGRYFSLPSTLGESFEQSLGSSSEAGAVADPLLERLMALGVLCAQDSRPSPALRKLQPATSNVSEHIDGRSAWPFALQAIWYQLGAARDLKRRPLRSIVDDAYLSKGLMRTGSIKDLANDAANAILSFNSTGLALSAVDNCLVRSLALFRMLARFEIFPDLVIGVTASPFAAHAWVQIGDVVLNDSVDRVRRFVPILII
jgi:hypothetical protein